MNTDREIMQQALEALEIEQGAHAYMQLGKAEHIEEAITALRERLAQPEQEPFCYHDGHNIVGKEYADHSDVFPLYTSPNLEQQKPVRFKCTVVDDAHPNGVPLSQWGKQHEMQPCAGRNCGSIDPNLHSAECFEDYEKSTGMNQRKPLTDAQIGAVAADIWGSVLIAPQSYQAFARAIEAAHGIGEKPDAA